ncbi:MYXO-CTERM domain-containing protein [Micromonospora viridifaciens]|uniref:MYXO-CTERM domain-containing protein n=1 Tax=Micromonospora viridifaciens TaxID=1881 RepID=A0A1C4ZM01_MICVI|nr:hypothetical protein [Micromonospora viridifaciens]SCF34100.1 MYXO-CTERM domain-containing protein [Micromonospora viridifaciens]
MRTLVERLGRLPLGAVGLAVTVCAAMAAGHVLLVRHVHDTGGEEWPQWVARWTIETYWGLLPLAFLALWARRRQRTGWLGRIGAAMLATGPVAALLIAVAATVWGAILGRGDLPASMMSLELLFYVMMLGVLATGIAFLLDAGVRWWGALLIVGLLADFVMPLALSAVYAVFGLLLMVAALRSGRDGVPVEPAVEPAH